MTPLIEEVSRLHFPNPPALHEQIVSFEQRVGWRLDPDLRAFYLHCDGADLFDRLDFEFRFYPLAQIHRARVVMRKSDTDATGPASWYALGEAQDSNFILLDISQQHEGRYPIRDGYNEAFPQPDYCRQIAGSFSEFLAGALRSEGRWFWLRDA